MPKYLSGRVKRTPQGSLTTDRYQYLGLEQAEPNLGDPPELDAIPSGTQYQIVSLIDRPGERFWVPIGGGIQPGSVTIRDEGLVVPRTDGNPNLGVSSITDVNFVGAAVTVVGFINPDGSPGTGVTVTVSAPGNDNEILFNDNGDFGTSTLFTFDNSTVGVASVGIGTTQPTQNLHIAGNLRLENIFFDEENNSGSQGDLLVKTASGGLKYTPAGSVTSGAGGTISQVQFHDSTGLVNGADNFVFDLTNKRVGIGSTQPDRLLDVLGDSRFTGVTTFAGELDVGGHTELDNLNVTGVSTFKDDVEFHGASGITSVSFDKSDNSLKFIDNAELKFGDSNDLRIRHLSNGDSAITEGGGGALYIGGSRIIIADGYSSNYKADFTGNEVKLYYSNDKKFSTSGVGVTVYNQLDVTNIVASGDVGIGTTNPTASNIESALESNTNVLAVGIITANQIFGKVTTIQETSNLEELNVTGVTSTKNLFVTGIATFKQGVSIGGTLTYEDVTNIDSVGLVTARQGIVVVGGGVSVASGIVTAIDGFKGDLSGNATSANTAQGLTGSPDINIGNIVGTALSISGISTFNDNIFIGVGATVGVGSTVFFGDDVKLKFGDTDGLEIYHSQYLEGANDSYIDSSARNLYVRLNTGDPTNGGNIALQAKKDSTGILVEDGAGVSLYYDAPVDQSTEGLRLTTTGVGVSVFGNLEVNNGINVTSGVSTFNGIIRANETGDNKGLRIHNNSGVSATNNELRFNTGQSSGFTFMTNSDGTNSDERLRITGIGSVGIGTDDPDELLHVLGNVKIQGNLDVTGNTETQQVTNLVSTGIITAHGIHVTGVGVSAAGISTFIDNVNFQDRVLVGREVGTAVVGVVGHADSQIQVVGTGSSCGISIIRYSNDTQGGSLIFAKSRSSTKGTNVTTQLGDSLGQIVFYGADQSGGDGDLSNSGARIKAKVTDDVSQYANADIPTSLIFETSDDDTALLKERMRIRHDGKVGINTASNINGRLHVQHVALAENILYATRYNDLTNDKPILAITEAQMDGMGENSPGLVIGNHNRDIHIGPVFGANAEVSTHTTKGIRITSDGFVGIGTANQIEAPLHVAGANNQGIVALFGAKDFVDDVDYNYEDATIGLQGENPSGTYQGAGVQYITRNPGLTNWHHGYTTFDRIGDFHIGLGGLGNTKATDKITILSTGAVGIGTTDPTGTNALTNNNTTLAVGIVTANKIFGDVEGGIIPTGDLVVDGNFKVTGISTFVGVTTFGNVGIGGSLPDDFLTDKFVVGDGGGSRGMTIYSDGTLGQIYFADGNTGDNRKRGGIVYDHSKDELKLSVNADDKFIIDTDGKVGINTTTPDTQLEVFGGATSIQVGNQSGLGRFGADGTSTKIGSHSNHHLDLFTNGSSNTRLRISSAGNVGIGSLIPREKLDVSDGRIILDEGYQLTWADGTTDRARIHGDSGSNFIVEVGSGNEEKFRVKSDGAKVSGNLEVTGQLTYEDVTNIDSVGVITAQSGINVTGAGISVTGISTFHDDVHFLSKVGIGTVDPGEKLDVNGAIRLRGNNQTTYAAVLKANYDSTHTLSLESYHNSNEPFEVIGTHADGGGANVRVAIAKGGQKVGIGTDNPAYTLDFGESSSTIRLVSENNGTAIRMGAGGSSNDFTLIRVDGQTNNHDGESDNSEFGFSLKYMGSRNLNNNSFSLFADDSEGTQFEAITVLQDGKVGIKDSSPSYELEVNGTVAATNFDSLSDRRYKTNIQVIENPIEKIMKIDGVSFNWKETNQPSLGVIADNIIEVLPEIVSGEDTKSVNYNGLIGLLIEVVKDQQKQIDQLRDLIDK